MSINISAFIDTILTKHLWYSSGTNISMAKLSRLHLSWWSYSSGLTKTSITSWGWAVPSSVSASGKLARHMAILILITTRWLSWSYKIHFNRFTKPAIRIGILIMLLLLLAEWSLGAHSENSTKLFLFLTCIFLYSILLCLNFSLQPKPWPKAEHYIHCVIHPPTNRNCEGFIILSSIYHILNDPTIIPNHLPLGRGD